MRYSIQISENDFGIFLLKMTYDFGFSPLERNIFIDRFFHSKPLQLVADESGLSIQKIQGLFARIYYEVQANSRYCMWTDYKFYKAADIGLASLLMFEFLDLSQQRLSRSKSCNLFLPSHNHKGIEALMNSFLTNNIYERFFQNVSSLTQFILAFDNFQKEFTHITDNLSQDKSDQAHSTVYLNYIDGLCNALPKIVKRLAVVSHYSESDICLNLLKKLEAVDSRFDERVQDRLERLYRQSADVNRPTMQTFTAIRRHTDELLHPHPKSLYEDGQSLSLNREDLSYQNQVNHNVVHCLQDIINDLNTKVKYLNTLATSLNISHRKQRLTLAYAIAKYPDVSARFPFDELDLYAVYCFVKRNLVAFNLIGLMRLEEAIAQGYLYCVSQMQRGVIFNDPTNYLKQNCYAAILDFYEGCKSEITEHPKIQKFKSLNQAHKERFEKFWNQCIESLLKNIWAEIEQELSSEMFDEKFVFADTGQIAKEYCQRLFIEFGQFDDQLSTILKRSVEDTFLGIWIDECDILLAKKLSLIDDDDAFIYAALFASMNKYVTEKLNYSLPIYSCHQTTTDKQRVKAKLENRIIECQKKCKPIHDIEIKNIKEFVTLIKSNKFLPFSKITTPNILHLGLSTLISTGIVAWINFTFLNPINIPTSSVNQLLYELYSHTQEEAIYYDSVNSNNYLETKTKTQHKEINPHEFRKIFEGNASWYSTNNKKYKKKETANKEVLNASLMTASHSSLPLNTRVRVTNIQSNKSAEFLINDYIPPETGKIINLCKEGAKKLGFLEQGITTVKVEVLSSMSKQ